MIDAPETQPRPSGRQHDGVYHVADHRRRGALLGGSAAATLNGLVTNDIVSLVIGQGCYALALTPKGRIIADVRVFRRTDHLLIDAPELAWPGFVAMLRKYVNPRLARFDDRSGDLSELAVLGPQAGGLLVRALGASVPETDYALVEATVDGQPAAVARTPGFGMPAYSVFASPVLVHLMADRLGEFGAARADPVDLDAARIAAGFPRWGVDMDETTLAQEANMDTLGAISYTKGCYTGQETVARVHFRGHVNRLLRGLLFQGGGALVPRGSTVELDGKVVGDVRSMAHSPSLGRIALAMLRREVEPGSGVSVQAGGDLSHATVVELPFPR